MWLTINFPLSKWINEFNSPSLWLLLAPGCLNMRVVEKWWGFNVALDLQTTVDASLGFSVIFISQPWLAQQQHLQCCAARANSEFFASLVISGLGESSHLTNWTTLTVIFFIVFLERGNGLFVSLSCGSHSLFGQVGYLFLGWEHSYIVIYN